LQIGRSALRIIHACKKWASKLWLFTLLLMQKVCMLGLLTKLFCIGPPPQAICPIWKYQMCAAANYKCWCNTSGYGFLSENSKFSKICQEHGIKFVRLLRKWLTRWAIRHPLNRLWLKLVNFHVFPGSVGILSHLNKLKKSQNLSVTLY
jgi:acetyl-CoA carboxylase biotin carboxylase subunit